MLSFARDDRGIAVVWVAISMGIIIGSAILAIDLSSIQATRTQLQNAADAAALAAVQELGPSSTLSLSEKRQNATQQAITFAALNRAFIDRTVGPVNITSEDVTFPEVNKVTVRTHRTEATGDPLRTYFIRLIPPFGDGLADVQADATAQIEGADAANGFFPWVLQDRYEDRDGDGEWDDAPEPYTDQNGNGQWDEGEPYEDLDKHGTYSEGDYYDPIATGYGTAPPSPFNDVGLQLVLKQGNPAGTLTSGFFYPCRWPPLDYYTGEAPLGGGDVYNEWIVNKSPYWVKIGDVLRLEYGNMQGPTKHGVDQIIDECPTSFFNPEGDPPEIPWVDGHSHDISIDCPRIGAIAFFDPSNVQGSSDKFVTVVKLSYWFVESIGAQNTVYGRLIEIVDADALGGGGFSGGFIYTIKLVE